RAAPAREGLDHQAGSTRGEPGAPAAEARQRGLGHRRRFGLGRPGSGAPVPARPRVRDRKERGRFRHRRPESRGFRCQQLQPVPGQG
nr:hypothetical protein [Tanacetum cinerariifolium]